MMKVRLSADLRCPKHPRFNPERDGLGALKAGCPVCQMMGLVASAARQVRVAVMNFETDATRLRVKLGKV